MNSSPTIMLVDDSPDDVALTLRAFKKNNITNKVVVAADGEEALRYLLPDDDSSNPVPDLVLLDINLPKVNGLEVLRRLRQDDRTRYLPVVVLTTSNEERDIVETYDLGANSFVRKPVVFGDFLEAVRVLGMYWLLVNQPAKGTG
ncbi:response regulator [Virgisporangium aurantiacum]|uniref:Two-component system response regulator n=1 Tax=Virgisporangium aurantiacum TaxID=175570 RepID=A0A8J3ZM99_9ACTN|nr:response regulator [Virgisporangium aurantiacum]GIJ64163.1 two-component system response regulator [Virgisporangium aurantiacum]